MLILIVAVILATVSAMFFKYQALKSGMGLKRWAAAGFIFGPLIWPMFCFEKRMKVYRAYGAKGSTFNA